jgi:hypothetical protein
MAGFVWRRPARIFSRCRCLATCGKKTLEAWVALDDRQQRGGAAISIENSDGSVFDAIVYGERQAGKWMAGSSGFERTRDLDAPEETSGPGVLVHLTIVYRGDNSIAVFRNGEPYGKPYTPASELRTTGPATRAFCWGCGIPAGASRSSPAKSSKRRFMIVP